METCAASIFKADELFHSEDEGSKFLQNSGPIYQITQHHTPEDCTGKAVPVRAMKAYDKAKAQLNVFITSAPEGWVVSFTPGCFISSNHQTEGWVDSTASMDILENRKPLAPATNWTMIPQVSSL